MKKNHAEQYVFERRNCELLMNEVFRQYEKCYSGPRSRGSFENGGNSGYNLSLSPDNERLCYMSRDVVNSEIYKKLLPLLTKLI